MLCIALDAIIRSPLFYLYTGWQLFFYALSLVASYAFFVLTVVLLSRLRKRFFLFHTLLLLFTVFLLVSFVGSFIFYFFNGFFPNYYTLLYFRTEPASAFTLLRDSVHLTDTLLFLGVGLPLFFWIRHLCRQEYPYFTRGKLFLSLGRLLVLYFFLWVYHKKFDQCLIVDVNFALSFQRHLLDRTDPKTYSGRGHETRHPYELSKLRRKGKFNVLVVVYESMRKDRMQPYGYERETTPYLEAFRQEHPDEFFVFERPYTVSSTTMLAVPAILTGIGPYQSKEVLYAQPIIWEYAKMLGYKTMFVSSHTMQWYRFYNFYAHEKPDLYWTKENSGKEFFNDLGIDDRHTVQRLCDAIKIQQKPFFGVIQLNATHYPYHIPKEFARWNSSFSDTYDNAMLYQDFVLKDLFSTLKEEKKLENTVIIFVSDHGESLKDHNNIGHVDSYYTETISIPLMIYLPKKIARAYPVRQLMANRSQITSNIDIAPTVVDLLKLEKHPQVKSLSPNFTGYSLFRKIPDKREVISMNNNEISRFRIGVSLVKGDYHYLWRINVVPNREEIYNLRLDPAEEHNLIDGFSKAKIRELTKSMRKYSQCRKYMRKYERF